MNNTFTFENKEFIAKNHMAILRNLRNIATYCDTHHIKKALLALKASVLNGKQFPFRYWSALKAIESAPSIHHKPIIMDALEECMDIALVNYPKLKGKTMCLSDNSGSAWGTCTSEYGTVTVAEINNLSSVLTSACSDEGYVGKFGDILKVYPVSKRNGVLSQSKEITRNLYKDVGAGTEGGIWKFFRDAIKNKEHWDNIFIYSDQQAGHGGLYGTKTDKLEYKKDGFGVGHAYINVFALVQEYRKKVNPKVNVFSIQTAGYTNNVLPENTYRTSILYGWTGKEAVYAQEIIRQWDEIEEKHDV